MNFLTLDSTNFHFCTTDMQPQNELEILVKAKLIIRITVNNRQLILEYSVNPIQNSKLFIYC